MPTFTVTEAEGRERPRLDVFVAGRDPELTRAHVARLVSDGEVRINGQLPSKPGVRLRVGDEIEVTLRPRAEVAAGPEPMALSILHEDPHLFVVDKPAGLVVHPAPGNERGTLVNGLLALPGGLGTLTGERPGVVHRLDKDTSGVMVVARDQHTQEVLSAAFRTRTGVQRVYVAICAPAPREDAGTIDTLYDRHPVDRKRFSSKVSAGRQAITGWEVLERLSLGAARIRCRLQTGRTHQIRVHMSDLGSPLVGDPLYGRRYSGRLAELSAALGRQALHAEHLELTHPVTGEILRLSSPPPADFLALLEALRQPGA